MQNRLQRLFDVAIDPLYPRVRTTASKEYGLAVNITRAELLDWMHH